MLPENNRWEIELIKNRHQELDLTIEQAEEIYKVEIERANFGRKHYFSVWEDWDYEVSSFRQILTADQLAVYEKGIQEKIREHEQNMVEEDRKAIEEAAYNSEVLAYYENELLPDLLKDTFLVTYARDRSDRAKIEYLKSEYKVYLNDARGSLVKEHFRHFRLLCPNGFRAGMLVHNLAYVLPRYYSFKLSADDAIRSVMNYMKKRIVYVPEHTEAMLEKKFNELDIFQQTLRKKYYGESQLGSWHVVTGPLSDEEVKEDRIMSLLLIDKDMYGLNVLFR